MREAYKATSADTARKRLKTVVAWLALHVLDTSALPVLAGKSGAITVSYDGSYGGLSGKAVALEPPSGLSFDTPLLNRPR